MTILSDFLWFFQRNNLSLIRMGLVAFTSWTSGASRMFGKIQKSSLFFSPCDICSVWKEDGLQFSRCKSFHSCISCWVLTVHRAFCSLNTKSLSSTAAHLFILPFLFTITEQFCRGCQMDWACNRYIQPLKLLTNLLCWNLLPGNGTSTVLNLPRMSHLCVDHRNVKKLFWLPVLVEV